MWEDMKDYEGWVSFMRESRGRVGGIEDGDQGKNDVGANVHGGVVAADGIFAIDDIIVDVVYVLGRLFDGK